MLGPLSLIILSVSLIIIATIFLGLYGYNYDIGRVLIILSLSITALMCYGFNVRNINSIKGRILRPSLLLLFGICIIVFQNIIDLLLGNTDIDADVFGNRSLIMMGISYGSMAMIAYIIGYISTNTIPSSYRSDIEERIPLKFLTLLSVILFLKFLSTIDQFFFTGQTYIESGSILESHTNNSEVLLGICNTAILVQHAINNRGNKISFREYLWRLPKIFLVLFFLYIILVLIRGTRFFAVRDLLLLVFSYIYCCRKQPIRNSVAIVLCFVMSFILSVISFSRVLVTDDLSAKYSSSLEGFENRKSFSPTTLELANSQFCDMVAINLFEQRGEPHLHGMIQLRYLAVIAIPNRILHKVWPVPVEKQGSAYLLTVKEKGRNSDTGLGSTIYTDFYVDFGLVGMVICMIFVGFLFKKMDLILYSDTSKSYTIFIIVLLIYVSACAFYLSRSALIPTIRMPLYAYILLKINALVCRELNK